MVEVYEYVVRIPVTDAPPHYRETMKAILTKEIVTRIGRECTVEDLPSPRTFKVLAVDVGADGVARREIEYTDGLGAIQTPVGAHGFIPDTTSEEDRQR